MEKSVERIKEEIAIWKVKSGKTDDDLAAILGISRQSLSRKKAAGSFWSSEIMTLCKAFGCDPNTLLGYGE